MERGGSMAEKAGKRDYRTADERAAQMIDAAHAIIERERSTELSLRDVADAVGASRALAYAYFADRYRLIEAVLDRQADVLREAGIEEAAADGPFAERAGRVAAIYLDHVAQHGSVLEIVMREPEVMRELQTEASAIRSRLYRRLTRAARRDLHMPAPDALALVQLLAVIPEEAGKQQRAGHLDRAEAHRLCERLLAAGIEAQVPRR
ncbi:MAG: hypothetical protein CL820_13720 [Croceicoccus sp.]|nr:hypothetical protein [Croceicoccus sp.]